MQQNENLVMTEMECETDLTRIQFRAIGGSFSILTIQGIVKPPPSLLSFTRFWKRVHTDSILW